ncbi:MAG: TadE/TadG family type IV pilus assembly protein [Cypionkella sp.]
MNIFRNIKAATQEDEGAILVFFAVTLAVVLGIVALSFDFGQKASTQSEMQSYADQVALASAGELDGKSDAITRATAAASSLISDTQTFASGSHALAGGSNYTLTFYSGLPASDTASMAAGLTTDPAKAIYARVVMTPRNVPYTFMAVFDGLSGTTTANPAIGASAVAGFTQYACDITPLMFCIPSPTFKADENIGKMIVMRSGGSGAAWGPGDFGFLDVGGDIGLDPNGPCVDVHGNKIIGCAIGAMGAVTQCFSQRGVDTEPGQKVGVENPAFNVRFDMYSSTMNGKDKDPIYAPAPNVIKGVVPQGKGASCVGANPQVSTDTVPLPHDSCLDAGTCGRYGNGNWATGRSNYVSKNYGTADPFPTVTTRYQYYLAEIAAHGGGASKTGILTGRSEDGRPHCSSYQSSDPGRRILVAAGIDCTAYPISGKTSNIPVNEFVRLFMTEPVGSDTSNPAKLTIYAEVVGSAQDGGAGSSGMGGIFHDVVQLYR